MTIESLHLLRTLLASQQLAVGADGFLVTAQVAARALAELDALIKEIS